MSKTKAEVSVLNNLEVGTSEFTKLAGKSARWIRKLTNDSVLAQCNRV